MCCKMYERALAYLSQPCQQNRIQHTHSHNMKNLTTTQKYKSKRFHITTQSLLWIWHRALSFTDLNLFCCPSASGTEQAANYIKLHKNPSQKTTTKTAMLKVYDLLNKDIILLPIYSYFCLLIALKSSLSSFVLGLLRSRDARMHTDASHHRQLPLYRKFHFLLSIN